MSTPILEARSISRSYQQRDGTNVVLRDLSLAVPRGARVGLVGPSGSGKSTLARCLALIDPVDDGVIVVDGTPIGGVRFAVDPATRRRVQLLWQAPRAAVDPRQRIADVIAEPLQLASRSAPGRGDRDAIVRALADEVGLTIDLLGRRPREVSDGQLQRACLARALAAEPDVLIADEPGSMLDASTQAALLAVLAKRVGDGLSVVLISHDHILLDHWCDSVHHLDTLVAGDNAPVSQGA